MYIQKTAVLPEKGCAGILGNIVNSVVAIISTIVATFLTIASTFLNLVATFSTNDNIFIDNGNIIIHVINTFDRYSPSYWQQLLPCYQHILINVGNIPIHVGTFSSILPI
jgi:hypothetical protein